MKGKEIILGLLDTRGPLTGYEINEIIQQQLNHFYDGSYGMIYPTLRKLEEEGLVTKQQVNQTEKPNKNVFSIQPAGKKVFQKALHADLKGETFKSDFLLKLYFGDQLTKQQQRNLLQQELDFKQLKLDALHANRDEWQQNGITANQQFTVDYGIATYAAQIKVLQQALQRL
ncbi:PadR family transcriptional regulator [Fructilactobacillus carniphilus]|uniref:PadR family transcriptional regulator n=1 Tax=Fructilactobacillus carniphilus TaxID=2940297 RepID=A0ABY5BX01_9LACO|nr:PadR family transcriptional regulator [Fructilactobacillus carniphilus]USS90852.1 PadR family transcriptional regulator [Fructilactobacillus carniphilus]